MSNENELRDKALLRLDDDVVSLWIIYFLNVGFPMYGGRTVNTFMPR